MPDNVRIRGFVVVAAIASWEEVDGMLEIARPRTAAISDSGVVEVSPELVVVGINGDDDDDDC